MSRPSSTNFKINAEVLEEEFKKRNLSRGDVSEKMGRTRCYLTKKLPQGILNGGDAMLLDALFNIPRELYEVKEVEEAKENVQAVSKDTEKQEVVVNLEVDYAKLYETIYNAVYNGTKKALE